MAALVLAAGTGGAVGGLGDAVTVVATGGGTAAGVASLEQFLEARVLRTSIPEYQFAGALLHEARERFGWN